MPVLETFFATNTQPKARSDDRKEPLDIHGASNFIRPELFKESSDPPVEDFGRVDLFHNRSVSI
jgi:hypothetical protein